jgi:hypothetical protein
MILLRIHQVCSAVVVALALVHTALTPVVSGHWGPGAVWFAGTGLGLLLLGALNIAARRDSAAVGTRRACAIANLVALAYVAAAVFAVPEPQAFVVLAALAGQALAGLKVLSPSRSSRPQ